MMKIKRVTRLPFYVLLSILCASMPLYTRRARKNAGLLTALNQPNQLGNKPSLLAQNEPALEPEISALPPDDNINSINHTNEAPKPTAIASTPQNQPVTDQDELVLPLELIPSEKQIRKEKKLTEPEATIELNFEDADLTNLIKQMEMLFNVTFITDEMIEPLPKGSPGTPAPRPIKGNKISFKTTKPLTRQETWDLFLTFLEMAQFTVVPEPNPSMYRIKTVESARRSAIPAYIGVDYQKLPDNDQLINYVYFIENSTVDLITSVVQALKSPDAPLIKLNENKAFLLTDKSYNIKTLMQIIKELDQASMPQAMSVIKLRNAEAVQVQKLYEALTQTPEQAIRPFPARRQPTSLYFPESARIIAEPRTNSLIILGQKDAIQKIEDFIIKNVDVALDQPFSPLFVHQLNYADANTIANIMTDVTKFGRAMGAPGQFGGVRAQDKFLGEMTFTPELDTNRLIIRGSYDDFLKAKEIIVKLDEQQPQVAMEVLILSMDVSDAKALGTQLRNKKPGPDGLLGPNIDFQTSGLHTGPNNTAVGIQTNPVGPGAERLLANLLTTIVGAGPGNTIISLGRDIFGVWGVLQLLQTVTSLQVLSNPFIVATNKTPSLVSVGQTRRVLSGNIIPGGGSPTSPTFDNDSANLSVNITPQINSDGMISLTLVIEINDFVNPNSATLAAAQKTTKKISTNIVTANKEVIALGGLVQNTIIDNISKVPVLGDIPIVGWLFKNKLKTVDRQNLLILISTRIIPADQTDAVNRFTQERILDYHGLLDQMHTVAERRDPIHKVFFEPQVTDVERSIDNFIFERRNKNLKSKRKRHKAKSKETVVENNETKPTNNALIPQQVKPVMQTQKLPSKPPMPQSTSSSATSLVQQEHNKNRLSLSSMQEQKGSA